MMSGDLWFFVLFVVFVVFWFQRRTKKRSTLPLPPGPPRTFWLGNALQMPKALPWVQYAKWAEEYGPIICLKVFSRTIIVLNTVPVTQALLDKRAANYSDRPWLWFNNELVGRRNAVFNISNQHPRFKQYRRLLTGSLNGLAVKDYAELIATEIKDTLNRVLLAGDEPQSVEPMIRRSVGASVMRIGYGYEVKSEDDYFVWLAERALSLGTQAARPGTWIVDSFPFLRFLPEWFPGAGFQRTAMTIKKEMGRINEEPHQWTKTQMESGEYIESFTSRHLKRGLSTEEEDVLKWSGAALYAGGAETSLSTLMAFFYIAALRPGILERARADVDSLVMEDGEVAALPRFEDRGKLPYIDALVKELIRWSPPAPGGLPHCVVEDDEFEGVLIPKGAIVISNIWGMARDPNIYKDPHTFDPSRFLAPRNELDPRKFAFGFGHRVCPGQSLAETNIYLFISAFLATFDIIPGLIDDSGNVVYDEPEPEFTTGITSRIAKPIRCRLRLRKEASRELFME